MDLQDPMAVYTAASNIEAHMIVTMLDSEGIPAYAVEDQSGASLWMLGTISQFHRPKVWVGRADADAATQAIEQFEKRQRELRAAGTGATEIEVRCEECGAISMFPASQNKTVQDCPKCGAYVDVGQAESEPE